MTGGEPELRSYAAALWSTVIRDVNIVLLTHEDVEPGALIAWESKTIHGDRMRRAGIFVEVNDEWYSVLWSPWLRVGTFRKAGGGGP